MAYDTHYRHILTSAGLKIGGLVQRHKIGVRMIDYCNLIYACCFSVVRTV